MPRNGARTLYREHAIQPAEEEAVISYIERLHATAMLVDYFRRTSGRETQYLPVPEAERRRIGGQPRIAGDCEADTLTAQIPAVLVAGRGDPVRHSAPGHQQH